jgi:hypothetical protein
MTDKTPQQIKNEVEKWLNQVEYFNKCNGSVIGFDDMKKIKFIVIKLSNWKDYKKELLSKIRDVQQSKEKIEDVCKCGHLKEEHNPKYKKQRFVCKHQKWDNEQELFIFCDCKEFKSKQTLEEKQDE